MIMRLLHPPLRKDQTLEMDRAGTIIIHSGHELHLGQKPKLGGRYADITLIYISYSVGSFDRAKVSDLLKIGRAHV